MTQLWLKVIKRQKIAKNKTAACASGEEQDVLAEMLREMDLSAPMWLDKHIREFENFRFTSFLPEHFIEPVAFDQIEISLIEEGVSRKSNDPRNAF